MTAENTSLLIVRHGPGRGRGRSFGAPMLDYVRSRRPNISQRVRLWETGSPLPDLSGVHAVLFWLADPLRELYPACFEEAASVELEARLLGIPTINPPEALSHTIKSKQAALWSAAGVPAARCVSFRDRTELETRLREVEFPAIVRPDLLHSQSHTHFCRSRADADRLDRAALIYPGVIIDFEDTREGYRRDLPDSVWARFYHKKRTFVFGDRVVPNHTYFSEQPIVGLTRSTFWRYRGMRRFLAPLMRLRRWDRAALEEDNAFWQRAPEHAAEMAGAARALELDVVALDYSTRADGSVIFWEANPYFALAHWKQSTLPHHRLLERRIEGFTAAYADFLEDLFGLTPSC